MRILQLSPGQNTLTLATMRTDRCILLLQSSRITVIPTSINVTLALVSHLIFLIITAGVATAEVVTMASLIVHFASILFMVFSIIYSLKVNYLSATSTTILILIAQEF